MYIFPTLEKYQATILDQLSSDTFVQPSRRHTQEGIYAGQGSRIYLFDETQTDTPMEHSVGTMGLDICRTTGITSLNHIECGKYCYLDISGGSYRTAYCKVGDFSNLVFHGPQPRKWKKPHVLIEGKAFCRVAMTADYDIREEYDELVPVIYIEGHAFSVQVGLLNWRVDLRVEKLDTNPLHVRINDYKLPEKLLDGLDTIRLDLRYDGLEYDLSRWVSRRYAELRNRIEVDINAEGRIKA